MPLPGILDRAAIPLVLAITATLALSGCSPDATPEPSATEKEASATTFPGFFSTCEDDDGDSDVADIESVTLQNDGTLVHATLTLAEPLDAAADLGFFVTAWSADGEVGYQFGTKFAAGEEIANFVFDINEATQANVDNGAVFVDDQVSSRYPVALLEKLGAGFGWYATVSTDGRDVDECGSADSKNVTSPE